MLRRYVSHETGDGTLVVGPELEDDPCERCGGESTAHRCPGDGRWHHHGRVHTRAGRLDPVCDVCIAQVWAEWNPTLTENPYLSEPTE